MNLRFLDITFICVFIGAIVLFVVGATGPLKTSGSKALPEELLVYCIIPLGITFMTVILSKAKFLSIAGAVSFLIMAAVYGKMLLIP